MKRKIYIATALAALLLLPALLGGCVFVGYGPAHVRGNGIVEQRDVTPGDFTGISIGGGVELVYKEGAQCKLEIETDENLFEKIRVSLRDDGTASVQWEVGINPTRSIVYVTAPSLDKIYIAGAVDFEFDDTIRTDTLKFDVTGACNGTLLVEARRLTGDISGASDVTIEGTCDEFDITLSGAGTVDAQNLVCKDADLTISGAGSMSVTCEDNLDATISGAGSITYYGDPHVSPNISGAATIRKG